MQNISFFHFWISLVELFQKHQELEIARQRIISLISWMFHAFKGHLKGDIDSCNTITRPVVSPASKFEGTPFQTIVVTRDGLQPLQDHSLYTYNSECSWSINR
jgi:hypothetical protein